LGGLSKAIPGREVAQMKRKTTYERLLAKLAQDFDEKLLEDPEFAQQLPPNSYVIFQLALEGAEDPGLLEEVERFNRWAKEVCEKQREKGLSVVIATLQAKVVYLGPRRPRFSLSSSSLDRWPRDFQLVGSA